MPEEKLQAAGKLKEERFKSEIFQQCFFAATGYINGRTITHDKVFTLTPDIFVYFVQVN